jgi:hypothetical protein
MPTAPAVQSSVRMHRPNVSMNTFHDLALPIGVSTVAAKCANEWLERKNLKRSRPESHRRQLRIVSIKITTAEGTGAGRSHATDRRRFRSHQFFLRAP